MSEATPKPIDPNVICRQVRDAIVKISEKCNTQLRSLVDSYLRCLSPAQAVQGSVVFPRSLKRHLNNLHHTSNSTYGDCLIFAIANAITAYYAAVRGNPFETRLISDLVEIAEFGPDKYEVVGSEREGYRLSLKH
jgi:hypothetical protein